MAGELVETSRLWARTVAAITAEQVEEVGQHLLPEGGGAIDTDSISQCMMASDCPPALVQHVLNEERIHALKMGLLLGVEAVTYVFAQAAVVGRDADFRLVGLHGGGCGIRFLASGQ
jgi:hypothetical protein